MNNTNRTQSMIQGHNIHFRSSSSPHKTIYMLTSTVDLSLDRNLSRTLKPVLAHWLHTAPEIGNPPSTALADPHSQRSVPDPAA